MSSFTFDLDGGAIRVDVSAHVDATEEAERARLRFRGSGPVTLRFPLAGDEHLVGLGERFMRLDQRGQRYQGKIYDIFAARPDDTYYYVPMMLSSRGYGVLIESYAYAEWDLGAGDPAAWSVTVPAADVHLVRGAPKRMLEILTGITGRPPLAPPWAFGVWKTTLSGTDAVLRHADRLRAEKIPVTACWVYDHYDEETNSGCGIAGTYPSGDYPDLSALTDGLHDRGYRALGYVQPAIYAESRPFVEAASRGWLVKRSDGEPYRIGYFNPFTNPGRIDEQGEAAYVDLTDPEASAWYAGLLAATLDQGWDGWMQDMGEHLPDDAVLADGTTGSQTRNRYPYLYHRLARDVWSRREAITVFARSGALGTAALVNAMWPGDQRCEWSADRGLRSVLPAGPSVGLTGVAAWGPDISGIIDGADGAAGGLDEELWLRWCQYGALNPIMRDHLGFKYAASNPVDLWHSDRTRDTFRRYAELHLRLVPYFYRLAEEASRTGVPIVRAMLLEHPGHAEAWTVDDQYLLGDALLVAPVHEKGARSRRVWFPPGEWEDWWDGARFQGPSWAEVPAPLDQIPLFQRAGTTVPVAREPDARLDRIPQDVEERRR